MCNVRQPFSFQVHFSLHCPPPPPSYRNRHTAEQTHTHTHTIIYIIFYKGTAILLLLLLCCRRSLSLKLKQSQLTSCWYVGGWGEGGGRVRSEPTTTMTELHCTPTSRHVTHTLAPLHAHVTSRHVTHTPRQRLLAPRTYNCSRPAMIKWGTCMPSARTNTNKPGIGSFVSASLVC